MKNTLKNIFGGMKNTLKNIFGVTYKKVFWGNL